MKTHVIIIGAGASGLNTARELSNAGLRVTVLEARDHTGGRTHTLYNKEGPLELGAEFIHGKLPATLKLLSEFRISWSRTNGTVWQVRNNAPEKDERLVAEHHRELAKKLKSLKEDLPVLEFLDKHFPGPEYNAMKRSVTGFVEGYESADAERFSTFAFREDWLQTEDWEQYRVDEGYGKLVQALEAECRNNGCTFHLSTVVKEIRWEKNKAEVLCEGNKLFAGEKAVITVPLGVLQAGAVAFSPALPEKEKAIQQLGFGNVIKILLLFKTPFWKEKELQKKLGENLDKLFFLFSNALIPTWWTQYPSPAPVLTGWLSGTKAKQKMYCTDKELLAEALGSLAEIFKIKKEELEERLAGHRIVNWCRDPFTRGSYNYTTVGADEQITILARPVENTIYFAGELFASGGSTVEAALASGLATAQKIIATLDV